MELVASADALARPRWRMGQRRRELRHVAGVNKGLETIEARRLFQAPWRRV
ncbi:MAG: hypothetical protein LBO66_12250 [Deltaproteobacteria bacterium]|nr:hypothetical protein [Deltaproteobacteria bacterium]